MKALYILPWLLVFGGPSIAQDGNEVQAPVRRYIELKPEGETGKTLRRIPQEALQAERDQETAVRAQALIEAGSIARGEALYGDALQQADTPQHKAEISAEWADALSRAARSAPDQAELQAMAAERYQEALGLVSGDARLRTFNNYGSLLLRQDKPEEALAVLRAVETDYGRDADPDRHARYLFNLGRAFEQSGELDEAAERYRLAALSAPDFSPASRRLLRIVPELSPTEKNRRMAKAWLETLAERGEIELLEQGLEAVLAWQAQDWPVDILMRYLTLARTGPKTFARQWQPLLPEDSRVAGELIGAYRDPLPIDFSNPDSERFSHLIRRGGPQAAAAFLKTVGDTYKEQDDYRRALERYALAWGLDDSQVETALATANLLLNYPNRIENAQSLTERFIEALFSGKGQAYLEGDLESILRFHMVLGTIFAQREQWGSRGDPYGALFQFARAVAVHQRLASSRGSAYAGPIAGVQAELARVYEHAGQPQQAVATYVEAAASALAEGDRELARRVMETLDRPEHRQRLTPEQRERIREMQRVLDSA